MYSGCTIRNTRSVNGWIVKTLGLLLITSLLLTGPGVAKASETSTFSDISGHKYEALIEHAAEDGWVNGCPDGRFWPDRPITRWEYAKMMLAALNIVPGSQRAKEVLQSTEVPKEVLSLADDGWASKEGWVELGFASGLVVLGDYGSYLVLPHDEGISRYEATIFAVRMLGRFEESLTMVVEEPPFDDLVPDMQVDNFGVIEIAVENGLISGYTETKFYPAESFTRGEAVATVSRVLTLLGRN